MKPLTSPSRRDFLKTTATAVATAAVAPAVLAARSPNETVGVGCIGVGTRGGDLINAVVPVPGVKVTAVCDVYKPHLQKGVDRSQNPEVKSYLDYHELLADPRVDAVVIGAPDHWHCPMVLAAARAGKDIYCEKGFSRTVEEAKQMRTALNQARVVFQLGHQARSSTCALQAKELLSTGLLGPVTLVRTGRFMSSDPAHPMWRWYGYYSQWNRPDPAQVARELNWDLWLGAAPKRPWDERRFWHWRCYWDYGTGQAGDLLSHELDFVQYLLGHGIPDTCNCAGLNALLKDDREVPDTWIAAYQWERLGRTVTFTGSMNTNAGQAVEICGKDAMLRFDAIAHDASNFTIQREGYCRRELPEGYAKGKTPGQPNHMVDFFNAVRSRGQPKCPVEEAFIESVTAIMSVEAFKRQRMVRWDAVKEQIV